MKKFLILIFCGLLSSTVAFGQPSNEVRAEKATAKFIERVEANLELTEAEKEIITRLKTAQMVERFGLDAKFEDKDELMEAKKENSRTFNIAMRKEVGTERFSEIIEAARKE